MRFGRAVPRPPCPVCNGSHALRDCPQIEEPEPQRVPLETPPHNGSYQGKAPVKVLAPGVSGSKEFTYWQDKSDKGHLAQRRAALQRTHCKKGHALTPENVYVTTDGQRRCRTCQRACGKARQKRDKQR